MSSYDRRALAAVSERARPRENEDRSGLFRSLIPGRSLSRSLWDLDFSERLPLPLSADGVEAVTGDLARIRQFLADSYPEITQEGLAQGPAKGMPRAKERYLIGYCDFLELRHGDQTVGVLIGAPEDWSTYYVRTFAVSPAYQRPQLLRRFIRDVLFAALRDRNVERIVAETSPANIAMSRLFCELRFHATGHRLTDRWGALVRYTKFFDEVCETAFMKRFADAAPRRLSNNRKEEAP